MRPWRLPAESRAAVWGRAGERDRSLLDASRNRWAKVLAAALALALTTVSVRSSAAVARARAPSEEVATHVDGDTVSEVVSSPSDLSLASAWTFEAPYSIDPHIAWREITSIPVGPQVWEIWRCDLPGEPTTLSPAAVVA